MYNATLYLNTGFNAVNVPDKLSTLQLAPHTTGIPALDIYQARELNEFRIKVNDYSQIRNADYLQLVNDSDPTDFAFYVINSITMTSMDVATLNVTMDYILTAGGVEALEFTDGMCERHHVSTSDDTFGRYDEKDPFLTPAEMLKIEVSEPQFDDPNEPLDRNMDTLIESTVDLCKMYIDCSNGAGEGIDYMSVPGNNVVTVPTVAAVKDGSKAYMRKSDGYDYITDMPHVALYTDSSFFNPDVNATFPAGWLTEALKYVRSLGVESCIIAQYGVPHYMIDNTELQDVNPDPSDPYSTLSRPGEIRFIKGSRIDVDLNSLPFNHVYSGYTVQNKRLFYGDNTEYTITSIASGNSANFLPEEIYNNDTCPTIEMRIDPRPKGCPYFRFDFYRGQSVYNNDKSYFINAVKGLEWQNVPLIFEGASGSLLNQYKYDATMAKTELNYQYDKNMNEMNASRDWSNFLLNQGKRFLSPPISIFDTTKDFVNQAYDQSGYMANAGKIEADYSINKKSELQSLLAQNNIVAPTMNFPISEGIRDYVGNECIVYRTYYSDNDIRRLDKILNMYGYRHTTPITNALLTNRSKFNYIQASGVTIKNTNIPKWIRDGVATQLSVGTRIWHQLPDPTSYTDGTNI